MVLAIVGDVVWQSLIAAAMTIAITWMNQRANAKTAATVKQAAGEAAVAVAVVADKAEAVRSTLEASTAATDANIAALHETTHKTLSIVNGNASIQLKRLATVSRQLADLSNDPEHAAAADRAEAQYDDHQAAVAASQPPSN